MRKLLLATAAATLLLVPWAAKADTVIDPLQFTCTGCSDNGTFTAPAGGGTATNITVREEGTQGGISATDFFLKVLIPNSFSPTGETFTGTVSGASFTGSTSLFTSTTQGTQFTSGSLEKDFFGITSFGNGAPPNPIGAFLPSTQTLDPTATGFFVFVLDLGALALTQDFASSPILLNLLAALPQGSWILGDACTSGTFAGGNCVDITTAQSAALFASQQLSAVPLPGAVWLFSAGLALLGWLGIGRKRREQGRVSLLGAQPA